MVRNGIFHAVDDELDPLLDLGDLFGQGGLAQLDARPCLVDQIDRLVGQEAVGNIAVGMRYRKVDRLIGVADRMKFLIAVLDSHDDPDGVFFVRRRHFDGLKTPFQRAVFLDGFAVFGGSGCADALDFAAGERRLENIGGVERAFGRSGADECVQLVDEDDGVLILHQLFHDGLEPLFKLAAVLGACDDERQIQRQYALVGEEAGDFAIGDALRQALDDGCLAHSRFADEHWIVLGSAAKDLDDAFEFGVASDQRIELGIHRSLGEIAGKLGQQARFAIPLLRCWGLFLCGASQFFADCDQLEAALVEYFCCKAFLFAEEAEQQVFGADVFVREPLSLFRCIGENPLAFVG